MRKKESFPLFLFSRSRALKYTQSPQHTHTAYQSVASVCVYLNEEWRKESVFDR